MMKGDCVKLVPINLTMTVVYCRSEQILSVTLALTDKFHLKVTGLKAGTAIPIHSHPYMYGFMKPLFGNGALLSFSTNQRTRF